MSTASPRASLTEIDSGVSAARSDANQKKSGEASADTRFARQLIPADYVANSPGLCCELRCVTARRGACQPALAQADMPPAGESKTSQSRD